MKAIFKKAKPQASVLSIMWLMSEHFNCHVLMLMMNLKELGTKRKIIFESATKIGENRTNILAVVFPNIFTFLHIKPNIYMQKTKFTAHKLTSWPFLLWKCREGLCRIKYTARCFTVFEKKTLKNTLS